MREGKFRPYWYVDMKWIFGILFTLSLVGLMISCNLFLITKKSNIDKVIRPAIKQFMIPDDSSEDGIEQNFEMIHYFAQENPESVIQIPGTIFQMGIMGKEIKDLTPEQLKDYLIDKFVEQIYKGDIKSLQFSGETEGEDQKEVPQALVWLTRIFNQKIHRISEILIYANIIACLIFILPFFLFSYHFGKLISLSVSALVVSLPFLIGLSIGRASLNVLAKSEKELAYIFSSNFWDVYGLVYRNYLYLFLAGVGFILIASVSKLACFLFGKKKVKVKTS